MLARRGAMRCMNPECPGERREERVYANRVYSGVYCLICKCDELVQQRAKARHTQLEAFAAHALAYLRRPGAATRAESPSRKRRLAAAR
jgi:hypothetical protein